MINQYRQNVFLRIKGEHAPSEEYSPMGKSPTSHPPAAVLSDAQANLNLFFYVNSP
ncbi:hypothetical protein [Photorhabdus noenieputensis]|uniref:hypothetical protein n=1 Tax=Photorhabdus noenieputensis TaxID=1208607 RepID=UPI001BD41E45|nr:hypothetical protein [Photorhabdus noenieputensis]MCK3668808.1 hypothetical protein [Photorhabdus noenieputensis]